MIKSKKETSSEEILSTDKNKSGAVEKKQYYFLSGLPRSGSTLLANILAQNPRFHSTSTSGIMDVMFTVRNVWNNLIEFQASPDYPAELRVLRGILESYFSNSNKPVIFDKGRGWLSEIEMAEAVLGHKIKIIVPVRDMREVVSSFEKLWRKDAPYNQSSLAREDYFLFQTVTGRVSMTLRQTHPIGLAYNRIVDAVNRGFADRLFFVDFEDLTHNPKETLSQIYTFLGEEQFEHDFENVKQITQENDAVYGIRDLHTIRKKVTPVPSDWKNVIGEQFAHLENLNFWKKKIKTNILPLE